MLSGSVESPSFVPVTLPLQGRSTALYPPFTRPQRPYRPITHRDEHPAAKDRLKQGHFVRQSGTAAWRLTTLSAEGSPNKGCCRCCRRLCLCGNICQTCCHLSVWVMMRFPRDNGKWKLKMTGEKNNLKKQSRALGIRTTQSTRPHTLASNTWLLCHYRFRFNI